MRPQAPIPRHGSADDEPSAERNIAFAFGCPRSGTSILGELIASHPDVKYVFEANRVWELGGHGPNRSHRLTASAATRSVRRSIRVWFDEELGSHRWLVEKNPRGTLRIPFMRAVFPEAKLIHIVRDGRDVACSLLPGMGGAEWRHLKPPGWRKLFETHTGVRRCALAWREIVEIALGDLEGVPHLLVRYEDLVADPRPVAAQIAAYLDIDEHPDYQAFCARVQNSLVDSYRARGSRKWDRDDHTLRVGRWRELARERPAEMEEVAELLGSLLERLGYV